MLLAQEDGPIGEINGLLTFIIFLFFIVLPLLIIAFVLYAILHFARIVFKNWREDV